MANSVEPKLKTIVLLQNWSAGKILIGTEYKLKDSERTIKLIEDSEYPNGKFIFDNGELFDPGKYFNNFFIEKVKKEVNEEIEILYDESIWDEVDKQLNGDSKSLVRKTIATEQINESFHDAIYYDVTDIIDAIISNSETNLKYYDKIYGYLIYNNYPYFTKEKLYIVFDNCKFEKTNNPHYVKVIKNEKDIGYLVLESGKYIFAPRNKKLTGEYIFDSDSSSGFFYTAENYLDIALSTLERYKEEFVPLYNTVSGKNKESYGYQADASIKTLLAFSCECYLKSLILNDGKNLNQIKDLGHGLSVLFTSLNDDLVTKIFSHMKRNGYNLDNALYLPNFETNDLTEKFMIDLAKVDDAFIDARYSAEKDKNTDYSFLYRFALALRHCSKKEYNICSPFDNAIDSKISKK